MQRSSLPRQQLQGSGYLIIRKCAWDWLLAVRLRGHQSSIISFHELGVYIFRFRPLSSSTEAESGVCASSRDWNSKIIHIPRLYIGFHFFPKNLAVCFVRSVNSVPCDLQKKAIAVIRCTVFASCPIRFECTLLLPARSVKKVLSTSEQQ